MRDFTHGPRADHDRRFTLQDWFDEFRNVLGAILIVRVRVHDDIRACAQRRIQSSRESARQPAMRAEFHDVIDAIFPRDGDREIFTPVVDDEPLDFLETRDRTRQCLQGDGEGPFLIKAGDLDDEFLHFAGMRRSSL